jgi:transposase InsO family protein
MAACCPAARNDIWSMDFVADQLTDGRRFRALTILDLFTRECLAIDVGQGSAGDGEAKARSPASVEAPGRVPILKVWRNSGGAGSCICPAAFSKTARSRAFPVKLLMRGTFDVFIDSAGFSSIALESTEFVETLWRRRESVPVGSLGR